MPLSLFHHDRLAHFQTSPSAEMEHDHTFGGKPSDFGITFNVDPSLHLIYRLDQTDPTVPQICSGVRFFPLVYGFRYAAFEGTTIYRVHDDNFIEMLFPTQLDYMSEFPYEGHPDHFPLKRVGFGDQRYNPTDAFDALALQGIFGIERLSGRELERAIRVGLSDSSYVSYSRNELPEPDWSDEQILRSMGRAPFSQGAPSKSCTNPNCTAEILYHVDESEIEVPPETAEIIGASTMKIGGYDVRVDTMRVFALHQPDPDEECVWGAPDVQLIFEFCEHCRCIRVSNQCT